MMSVLKTLCIAIAFTFNLYLIAQAQTPYPSKPIRLVVPFTPGGVTDTSGRLIAEQLSKRLGQQVVIDNKSGASGNIGTQLVASAEPDGYTLLVQSASYAANPAIYKKLPYDLKSLTDLNILGTTPYLLIVGADSPYKTIKDLVAAAKAKPGDLPYASAGIGSSTHLAAEYFNQTMGIKMLHVPYKGSPEAITETIAGRTAFYMAPFETAMAQVRGGKARALGITSIARASVAPEIPTIAEQGYPNFDIGLWFGVWAPSATPEKIKVKINEDINRALQDVDIKIAYAKAGITSKPMNLEQTAQFVRNEIAKYTKIAKDAGIEPQ